MKINIRNQLIINRASFCKRKCTILYLCALMVFLLAHCNITNQNLPDYPVNNQTKGRLPYKFNYLVGDKFELVKPMFVIKIGWGAYTLTPPGKNSPSIQAYQDGSYKESFQIIKMLPAGSVVKVVAIKYDRLNGGLYELFSVRGLDSTVGGTRLMKSDFSKNSKRVYRCYRPDLIRKL